MEKEELFYDVHFHIMNLSHPNILAFIKRISGNLLLTFLKLPNTLIKIFIKKPYATNLLSLMDKTIEDYLEIVNRKDFQPFLKDNNQFNKMIITPLMMDFGNKKSKQEADKKITYDSKPHKAIKEQVIDVFSGLKEFYDKHCPDKNIEIYPFLGLNTANYEMDSSDTEIGLKDLLDKYFRKYEPEPFSERRKKLYEELGKFNGNIKDMDGRYFFSGIKVYPPLGFHPWPKEEEKQLIRVKYLYRFCIDHGIPITAHCGGYGYNTMSNKKECREYIDPVNWYKALSSIDDDFKDLQLNLAHFGGKLSFNKKHVENIIKLLIEFPNVYSDISYLCKKRDDYKKLFKLLKKHTTDETYPIVLSKLLFGSDFMIKLMDDKTYIENLNDFVNQEELPVLQLCRNNPESFLGIKKDEE